MLKLSETYRVGRKTLTLEVGATSSRLRAF